jgi:hypothetical protein
MKGKKRQDKLSDKKGDEKQDGEVIAAILFHQGLNCGSPLPCIAISLQQNKYRVKTEKFQIF